MEEYLKHETFIKSVETYNEIIFPFQFLIVLACTSAMAFLFLRTSYSDRIISVLLSALWFWASLFFLFILVEQVHYVSLIFGILFGLQGLFFLYENIFSGKLNFDFKGSVMNYAGLFYIFSSIIFYPLLGGLLGRNWSEILTTGLPCPTVLLTFGFLLISDKRTPLYLFLIPNFWVFTAFFLGLEKNIFEIVVMVAFTFIANIFIFSNKSFKKVKNAPLE